MSIAEQLEAAADLLEKGWCQGWGGYDASGQPVGFMSESAASLCLDGAICRVLGVSGFDNYDQVVALVCQVIGMERPLHVRWNDAPERTQAEVVAAVRKAAQLAREAV